jgi:drug/metabolite transporter (DMT)-like permease
MVLSVALLTCLDTILKVLAARYDPVFLAWGRNLAQVVYLGLLIPIVGPARMLRIARPWVHAARGACLLGTTVLIVLSLQRLPMAQTYAVTFSTPLLATGLAIVFLGESVSLRRLLLIAAGFGGVLVALNPGGISDGTALMFPLGMAGCNAVFHVLTRFGGRDESPYALLFYVAVVAMLLATPALPFVAAPLALSDGALLAAGGALGTAAHLCMIGAFRIAPTAIVSPMVYSQIIVAGLLGFVLFGEAPTLSTLVGAAIVAGSGILLLRVKDEG